MTPEAAAKADIKKGLEFYKIPYAMPVQFGYGRRMVDFYCCLPPEGRSLLIEAKRFKAKPRPFQRAILDAHAAAGGISIYAASCWADVEAVLTQAEVAIMKALAGTPLLQLPAKAVKGSTCFLTKPGG